MAKLSDFRDLESGPPMSGEEMRDMLAKMPQSYWDNFAKVVADNARKFEDARKSITPTYEDMHRPFDL